MANKALLHLQQGPSVVQLNVGGSIFQTSKDTLLKPEAAGIRELMVGAEDGNLRFDCAGRLFLDSNPRTFEVVLDFLRDGAAALPGSQFDLSKLWIDARKFKLCDLEAQVLASLQLQQQQPQLGNGGTAPPASRQPLGGAPGLAASAGSQGSPERRQPPQQTPQPAQSQAQQSTPPQQTPQPAQSQAQQRPQQALLATPARKAPAPGTHTTVSPPALAPAQEASVAASAATAACGVVSKRKRAYFEFAKREWETDPQFQLPLPLPDGSTHWPDVEPGNPAAEDRGRVHCRLCRQFDVPPNQFCNGEGYVAGRRTGLIQHQTKNTDHIKLVKQLEKRAAGQRQGLQAQQAQQGQQGAMPSQQAHRPGLQPLASAAAQQAGQQPLQGQAAQQAQQAQQAAQLLTPQASPRAVQHGHRRIPSAPTPLVSASTQHPMALAAQRSMPLPPAFAPWLSGSPLAALSALAAAAASGGLPATPPRGLPASASGAVLPRAPSDESSCPGPIAAQSPRDAAPARPCQPVTALTANGGLQPAVKQQAQPLPPLSAEQQHQLLGCGQGQAAQKLPAKQQPAQEHSSRQHQQQQQQQQQRSPAVLHPTQPAPRQVQQLEVSPFEKLPPQPAPPSQDLGEQFSAAARLDTPSLQPAASRRLQFGRAAMDTESSVPLAAAASGSQPSASPSHKRSGSLQEDAESRAWQLLPPGKRSSFCRTDSLGGCASPQSQPQAQHVGPAPAHAQQGREQVPPSPRQQQPPAPQPLPVVHEQQPPPEQQPQQQPEVPQRAGPGPDGHTGNGVGSGILPLGQPGSASPWVGESPMPSATPMCLDGLLTTSASLLSGVPTLAAGQLARHAQQAQQPGSQPMRQASGSQFVDSLLSLDSGEAIADLQEGSGGAVDDRAWAAAMAAAAAAAAAGAAAQAPFQAAARRPSSPTDSPEPKQPRRPAKLSEAQHATPVGSPPASAPTSPVAARTLRHTLSSSSALKFSLSSLQLSGSPSVELPPQPGPPAGQPAQAPPRIPACPFDLPLQLAAPMQPQSVLPPSPQQAFQHQPRQQPQSPLQQQSPGSGPVATLPEQPQRRVLPFPVIEHSQPTVQIRLAPPAGLGSYGAFATPPRTFSSQLEDALQSSFPAPQQLSVQDKGHAAELAAQQAQQSVLDMALDLTDFDQPPTGTQSPTASLFRSLLAAPTPTPQSSSERQHLATGGSSGSREALAADSSGMVGLLSAEGSGGACPGREALLPSAAGAGPGAACSLAAQAALDECMAVETEVDSHPGDGRDDALLQLIHQSSIGASLPLLADFEELTAEFALDSGQV
ncbi:hypothetical protein N2152v2_002273 [Parachlorella kessleri]